jgi:pimeloyl-ACP methyl ester carboxylesterase
MVDRVAPREVTLSTARGPVRCAYHAVDAATVGVLAVGGTDGGLDGPADALYPDLADDLAAIGMTTLRIDFRGRLAPGIVAEGVFDLEAGLQFLRKEGLRRFGVVGHSFGGAVVIAAAADAPDVVSVATLSTQTAGAQPVSTLAPRPILLIHGLDDIRLSPDCSRLLYRLAGEPKRIELLEGARHSLRQRREDVRRLLREWFAETLPLP